MNAIALGLEAAAERDRLREINASLLEALKGLLITFDAPARTWGDAEGRKMARQQAWQNVRTAIAKAEGREP